MKGITDDVDSIRSFDELGLAQMPVFAIVSAIEPWNRWSLPCSPDSSRGSLRRHALWTHLDLPRHAIVPCWHLHRQLAPLTHLELHVEDHCRCSFFVVLYSLFLCASVSPCCTVGLLLTSIPRLAVLGLMEFAASSLALMRLLFWLRPFWLKFSCLVCLLHPNQTDSYGPQGMDEDGCARWLGADSWTAPKIRAVPSAGRQQVPMRGQSSISKLREKIPTPKGNPVESKIGRIEAALKVLGQEHSDARSCLENVLKKAKAEGVSRDVSSRPPDVSVAEANAKVARLEGSLAVLGPDDVEERRVFEEALSKVRVRATVAPVG